MKSNLLDSTLMLSANGEKNVNSSLQKIGDMTADDNEELMMTTLKPID